jgi:hypothetical protein
MVQKHQNPSSIDRCIPNHAKNRTINYLGQSKSGGNCCTYQGHQSPTHFENSKTAEQFKDHARWQYKDISPEATLELLPKCGQPLKKNLTSAKERLAILQLDLI